jgi:hypothetical protein
VAQTREEAELRARLVKEIVLPEVLVPMEANGWRQGQPNPAATDALMKTLRDGQPGTEGAPGNTAAPAVTTQPGQPGAKVDNSPAPVVKAKADNPGLDDLIASYEALRDPATGLIARKYATIQEAIKGGVHLTHMAKDALAERDLLKQRVAELEAAGRQPSAANITPAAAPQPVQVTAVSQTAVDQAQARYDKVLSDIAENGGVLDVEATKLLSKASRELAEATANWKVQENFAARDNAGSAEKTEWQKVDSYMKEKHPAAERFSEEVAVFIDSDPLVKRAVQALLAQGDKVGATEHAWVSFQRAHGEQVAAADRAKAEATEAELAAREQVRKEQVEKARRDAGIVTGSAGGAGAHENRNVTGASREEINAAMDRMRREGEAPGSPGAMAFRKMVIGPSLGFLNQP